MQTTLIKMDHYEPTTPIVAENLSSVSVTNSNSKQRHSRAINMIFCWIRDSVKQGQLIVFCKPGAHNLDEYTKEHHPEHHHLQIRPTYLHPTGKNLCNAQ